MAAQWTNHAKNDIRQHLIKFMQNVGTDQATLADALGMSVGEIDQILNGNGEISLSTFAKMLIASDLVLEIKPMSAMPRGAVRPSVSRAATAPKRGPQRDANGRFVSTKNQNHGYPSPSEMPMPPHGAMPMPPFGMPMPPRGSVMPYGNPQPMMQDVDLDELDRKELIDIINQQGFSREIDTRNATRKEIIAFLEAKQSQEMPNVRPSAHVVEPQQEEVREEQPAQTRNVAELGARLLQELENNPQLADALGRVFGGQN